jgi:membrane protein implicated in regulation of membrane protease activity
VPTFDAPTFAWLALALVAAIVEVSIPHFGLIFVTFGALAAAAAAFFAFGISWQLLIFAVTVGASVALLRPRLVSGLDARGVPSRTEPLVGREGLVTQDIETVVGSGRVNVGGQDWAARAAQPIPAGSRIKVVGADGIVLEVTRV